MAQFVQIELLVLLECAFNCALVVPLRSYIAFSMHCPVETLFRDVLFCNDWKVFIPLFPYTLVIMRLVDTPTDQQSRS